MAVGKIVFYLQGRGGFIPTKYLFTGDTVNPQIL